MRTLVFVSILRFFLITKQIPRFWLYSVFSFKILLR
jgi:hypothetical protein